MIAALLLTVAAVLAQPPAGPTSTARSTAPPPSTQVPIASPASAPSPVRGGVAIERRLAERWRLAVGDTLELARDAAARFDAATLWGCTLVTTVEPCAMCAATQYWAHIGRLAYGLSEARLLELTGNHHENPTLNLPCRDVFAAGQKAVQVIGPVPEVEAEIAALHAGFWGAHPGAPQVGRT